MFELLKYPIMLFFIIFGAVSFMSFFLLPQFAGIYQSFDMEVSIMGKSFYLLMRLIPYLLILILVIIVSILVYLFSLNFEKRLDLLTKNKKMKNYYYRLYNHIFIINLSNLMSMGLKLDEIFLILKEQNHNLLLKKEAEKILIGLHEGKLFYECLERDIYPQELVLLVKDGEEYQTLATNIDNYNAFLKQNKEAQAKKMLFMIQPILYGIFGILIIILYASIFMPMFAMMDQI
jgi:competence protein ComGB